MVSNKQKRKFRQYVNFFFTLLVSVIGLLTYIICSKAIPFPDQWLPKIENNLEEKRLFLFFSGISIHLQVNFFLGFLFLFLDYEKIEYTKIRKIKFWVSKILTLFFSLLLGLGHYWERISKKGLDSIFLLCLILIVISCFLVELIQLMNQYGVCDAFSLILLTEFTPFKWFQGTKVNSMNSILLFVITILFTWIVSLKWENYIETNSIYTETNEISNNGKSKLGFRLNLSFMPLIYLSSLIKWAYIFMLMKGKTKWFKLKSIQESYKKVNRDKIKALFETSERKGFWESFFIFNEREYNFSLSNIKKTFNENTRIVGVIILIIFLRWLTVWLQMRKIGIWKTRKISKDLRNSGIYIDQIAPGLPTRQFLKKIINKLILMWIFVILIFNISFDSIFLLQNKQRESLSFMNWFGGINIAVDIIRQITTKYKYMKTSN